MKKTLILLSIFSFGMLKNHEDKPRREFYTQDKTVAMTFNADGNLIAASSEKSLEVYHTRMGLRLKNLPTGSPIKAIEASPNQPNVIACLDASNTITFWDIDKGKVQKKIISKEPILGIQYRQDGREILLNTSKNAVFYNISVGKKTQIFKTTNAVLMAYSQATKTLVTTQPDNSITVWDLENEKKKHILGKHQGKITHIAFNKAGTQLVSSSLDKSIKIWDLKSGQETKQIVYDSPFNFVAYDLDETKLLTASDDAKTIIWNISADTPNIIKQYTGASQTTFVGRHPKEQILLSGYGSKTMQTWLVQ